MLQFHCLISPKKLDFCVWPSCVHAFHFWVRNVQTKSMCELGHSKFCDTTLKLSKTVHSKSRQAFQLWYPGGFLCLMVIWEIKSHNTNLLADSHIHVVFPISYYLVIDWSCNLYWIAMFILLFKSIVFETTVWAVVYNLVYIIWS